MGRGRTVPAYSEFANGEAESADQVRARESRQDEYPGWLCKAPTADTHGHAEILQRGPWPAAVKIIIMPDRGQAGRSEPLDEGNADHAVAVEVLVKRCFQRFQRETASWHHADVSGLRTRAAAHTRDCLSIEKL